MKLANDKIGLGPGCPQEVIYEKLSTVRPLLPFLVTSYSLSHMQSQKNSFFNSRIFTYLCGFKLKLNSFHNCV